MTRNNLYFFCGLSIYCIISIILKPKLPFYKVNETSINIISSSLQIYILKIQKGTMPERVHKQFSTFQQWIKFESIIFFSKKWTVRLNFFRGSSLYDICLYLKQKKCFDSLLEGAKLLMIKLVYSPLSCRIVQYKDIHY